MQKIISMTKGVARREDWRLRQPADFELCDGEHIAVVGDNGSGKTLLVDMIRGSHPLTGEGPVYDFSPSCSTRASENIIYICFKDSYGTRCDSLYYLQQRWNSMEIDEDALTVGQKLRKAREVAENGNRQFGDFIDNVCKMFHLDALCDKYVVTLSSGELRKLTIACAIMGKPRVMVLDNPFVGLDAKARETLRQTLETLVAECRMQIVLVVGSSRDIPDFITHVVEVSGLVVGQKTTRDEFLGRQSTTVVPFDEDKGEAILHLPYKQGTQAADIIVKMNGVSIKYGDRTILHDVNWTVKNGECWALKGPNGSGKSTLLSLVCADNPQAYACDITLFDCKRGNGESIWDIKKHIGYVSPELHRAMKSDVEVVNVVASGLYNLTGCRRHCTAADCEKALFWINVFGIGHLAKRRYLSLSSGEQRLALLARAFVKDPELLILDEPFHGLDDTNRQLVGNVISTFCLRRGKTLIMVSHYDTDFPECVTHEYRLVRRK